MSQGTSASRHQDSARRTDKYNELVGTSRAEIHRNLGTSLPELALVLGSGFQDVLGGFEVERSVSFHELPGFPRPTVRGHSGTLARASIEGLECLVCCGRAHYYEGHPMEAVTFPVRALAACGVRQLLLTNAAGGIDPKYRPGDFMLLADHINFMGASPLRGMEAPRRFVDLSAAYSPGLRQQFLRAARRAKVRLHQGVYLAVAGPNYETPAEIRAFARLGASAVGMSTVPEVLMARAFGLEVAAISCITNPAAGLRRQTLSHEEVLRAGKASAAAALRLLREFARGRARSSHQSATPPRRKNLNMDRRQLRSGAKNR